MDMYIGLLSVLLDIYSEVGMLLVVLFAFLENFQTIFFFFMAAYTTLQSHQQCARLLIFLHSCHYLMFSVFFFFSSNHSNGCEVFYCGFDLHFLMISDVEYVFIGLWAICISPLSGNLICCC